MTYILACGCLRKYRILDRFFNSIAYGVRFSPISVFQGTQICIENEYFLLVVSSLISAETAKPQMSSFQKWFRWTHNSLSPHIQSNL